MAGCLCSFLCCGNLACTGSYCSKSLGGGSAYNACCTLTNSVINTTGPATVTPPDAGGGSGSFPTALQSTLTTGLSCRVDGLLGEFGLGSFSCLLHVNANQGVTPAAAPACTAATASAAGTKAISLKTILIGAALLGALYFIVKKA
jgi:hypothetical protein